MFLQRLLAALAEQKVPYCLVGGVAVNLHGIPRMTYDVNLVCSTQLEALQAMARVLSGLGLRARLPVTLESLADPELRRELLEERNLIALTFTDPANPLNEVDVLVSPPIPPDVLVARSTSMTVDGVTVRVVSRADLIAMKRAGGRAQDLTDASHLERLAPKEES